jgi:hypothetical protein
MSSNKVPKSPVEVADEPTLTLAPLVLILTCNLSGKGLFVVVRVQNFSVAPFCRTICGVKSQTLSVEVPVPALKFAPI